MGEIRSTVVSTRRDIHQQRSEIEGNLQMGVRLCEGVKGEL